MTAVHDVDELAALEQRVAELRAERTADEERIAQQVANGKTVNQLRDEADAAESEDFNAFWESRKRVGKTLRNVRGVDVALPAELPLRFEIEARRLKNDKSPAAVSHLFGLLFGAETYSALYEAGLTPSEFGVLLMWGIANANGVNMSLAEAESAYEDAKAKSAAGKAVVPSDIGGTSSGFGVSSRPISHGNTRKKARNKRSRR